MTALHPSQSPNLLNAISVPVWTAAFLSPTLCFVLLMVVSGWFVPPPTEGLTVLLLRLIALAGLLSPVMALLVCGRAVWRSNLSLGKRAGGLAFMLLGMSFQVAILLIVIVSAVTVAIAPAQ